jgi:hypothetical protein
MIFQMYNSLKINIGNRLFIIGLVLLLIILITSSFAWMQMDHVIAPPGVRIMDGLWRVYIVLKENPYSIFPSLVIL